MPGTPVSRYRKCDVSRFLTGLDARFGMMCMESRGVAERLEAAPFQSDGANRAAVSGTAATSLLKSLNGGSLVFLHVEDSVELGDLEQVVHLFGQVEQLEFAALVLGGGERAHQFADA